MKYLELNKQVNNLNLKLMRIRQFAFRSLMIAGITITSGLVTQSAVQAEPSDTMTVTLLGTGTPALDMDRFGFSNLVQVGGLNLLFDSGRGAALRLGQMRIPLGKIDGVFLTHFHSDHVNGLADVFLTGYIRVPSLGGRVKPLELFGPSGTKQLADGLQQTFSFDIKTRILDEGVPEAGTQIVATELDEGVIFEKNGVKVTVFPVLHGKNIDPSVGYRVDYKGRSVVFSGDTKFDQNVIDYGKGVDLLIHEAGSAPQEVMDNPVIKSILDHHTSPEDVGRVFAATNPSLAVYSHVVRLWGANGRTTMQEIVDRTRETYNGPLIVGEDLMQFSINSSGAISVLAVDH